MTVKRVRKLRHQRHTLILLIVVLVVFGLLIAFAPLTDINFWGIDIYTFRAAAKAMAWGENPYYEPNILRFADGAEVGKIHNFVYLPFFGFLLRPFAWLPPAAASRVWFTLNLIFYFSSIILFIKAINWQAKPRIFLLAMIALIFFPPLRTTLIIGQSSFFLLFWFALSYFLLKRHWPVWGGLTFSLALFKPHLAPLLLFYLIKRQWKFLAGVALGGLILTLPFLNYLDEWIASATAAYDLNIDAGGCLRMVSTTAMVECFAPAGWSSIITGVLVLITLIFLIPYLWQDRTLGVVFDRHMALFIVAILLLLDNVRIADQILLVFPLLVIWRDWACLQSVFKRRLAIALMMMIYLLPYIVDFLQPYNIAFILPLWYLAISLSMAGLLLLQLQLRSTM